MNSIAGSIKLYKAFGYLSLLIASFSWADSPSLHLDLSESERHWLAENPVVTVAFDGYFPPYSFLNEQDELEGFSVDLFSLISERLNIEFKVHPEYIWKELYQSAQNNDVDIVAAMVRKPEREAQFNFTSPYIDKTLVVVTRDDDSRINHKDDLVDKTVALVEGYQYVNRILKEYPTVTPIYFDTIGDMFKAVSIGDADAAVAFLGAGHLYRSKYLLSNLKYAASYDKQDSKESVAVRKDLPELASILDKTIRSISEAKLHQLREKWLPVEYLDTLVEINLSKEEIQWIKDHPVIRLGIDPEFAPFEFMEEGRYSGIASDYIRLLIQRLNINLEVVEGLTWSEVIEKAKKKDIDVLPAVGITDERKQFLSYTQPYLNFHRVIVTQADAPFVMGLDYFTDKKVAVQANSSHSGFLKENFSGTPIGYDTLQEALLAVSGGEVDAFVGNVASATYWINKFNLTNLKIAAPVSNKVQSLHFAVRDDWPELVSILQKGLNSITAAEERNISQKWMSVEFDRFFNRSFFWTITSIFFGVVALILLWNILLKRKVNEQTALLTRSAHYDQLTDLPNRFLVQDRLGQRMTEAKRSGSQVAVYSIDLNDFKKVTDHFGYQLGDQLLQIVAQRISLLIDEGDTLGRISGKHFLVIKSNIESDNDTVTFAESIIHSFKEAFTLDQQEVMLTACLGISMFPLDGKTPAELIKNADSAVNQSKHQGYGTYTFYTKKLNKSLARWLDLEHNLQGALERDELYTVFQPKVDATNTTVGFEALLRWDSAVLGMVSPVEFIPIAEKNGQIIPIGLFVLKQALKQVSIWRSQFNQNFVMAVNISPAQFRSETFVEDLKEIIRQSGIPYSALEVEITEGILMMGNQRTESILNELTSNGIRLAMDDFGTGYSSMSNLRRFNFDVLKIDREFIKELPNNESDMKLVAAIIAMAHGLTMEVVGEGVETEAQKQVLLQNSCDRFQGWLFGRPAKPDELTETLKQQFSCENH